VRDQVSHPYKTTDKIIVLYILILKDNTKEQETACHLKACYNKTYILPLHKLTEEKYSNTAMPGQFIWAVWWIKWH
jgi:hypothetical protein